MCEGIELGTLLASAKGELLDINCSDDRLSLPAMSLALHKHKSRHSRQILTSELLKLLIIEATEELAHELAVFDVLAEYFPHATIKWHNKGGPYDITLTWKSGLVAYFDVKSISSGATITQQSSEAKAIVPGSGLEEIIYLVLTRLTPTTAVFTGAFLPIEEEGWTDSALNDSRYIRQGQIKSWI